MTLSRKIALTAFLSLAVTLSVMIAILITAQTHREKDNAIEEATHSSELVVQALVFAMREGVSDVGPFEKNAVGLGKTRQLRVMPLDQIEKGGRKKLDTFEASSLTASKTVSTTETYQNEPVVRIATPIFADQTCVDCHGGKVGDPITVVSLRSSMADAHTAIASQRTRAILMALGTLLLTTLIIFLLVNRKIVTAIKSCVAFAGKLATGDLSGSLDLRSNDESGQLADSFRSLQAQLSARADAAERISSGDLDVSIEITSDEDTLGRAMRKIVASLAKMRRSLDKATAALKAGDIDARCANSHLEGAYAELVDGVNGALDSVIDPVVKAVDIIDDYAAGNLERELEELPGKQRVLSDGLASIRANLRALVAEATMLSKAAEEGRLDVRGEPANFKGDYRNIIEGMNETLDHLQGPVHEAVQVLERMAEGDLKVEMHGDYRGDHEVMKRAVNEVLNSLNYLLGNVENSVFQVRSGSEQVASSSQSLSDGATQQAASLEEITSSMEEMAGQAQRNLDDAREANKEVANVRRNAGEGSERMDRMLVAMTEIDQGADEISRIIKTIDEIAFQTNLLALNAAVEAARAGVHGKGFAVVAEEVRNLAQRSARAARETTQLIEGSIEKAANGSKIAEDTAESLSTIVQGIDRVNALIEQITQSSEEQTSSVKDIHEGLHQIDQVTQSNSSIAEESASAAEELSGQTESLREMLAQFQLRHAAAQLGGGRRMETPRLAGGNGSGSSPRALNAGVRDFADLDVDFSE